MLDIKEIENTIAMLENGETTFASCEKLAALYIVRQNFAPKKDEVEKEYQDILPSYELYKEIKRKFQLHEVGEEQVASVFSMLCQEISEFLRIVYSNLSIENEIFSFKSMLKNVFLQVEND